MNSADYRRDIDGLRAVAVIPVLLFHANVPGFTGGYVGVDVFFAISGYLITGIILKGIEGQRFTIANFLERRIRRILPALLLVLTASLVAGLALLLPIELGRLGDSLVSTAALSANVMFWLKSGYFEVAAEQHPLLHVWSLAVEEQFYLAFPWLLVFLVRRRFRLHAAIALLALLSFILCIAMTRAAPSSAFYLPISRGWELLGGAILATPRIRSVSLSPTTRESLAATGMVGLLVAFFFFSKETAFPGFAAALPVLATMALVASGAGGETRVSRLLSARGLVWVGKISYSLYLWHWPLLVFARYRNIGPLSSGQTAFVLGLSVVLAALTFRFVEQPARAGTRIRDRRIIFVAAVVSLLAFAGSGAALRILHGLPVRFSQRALDLAAGETDFDPRRSRCMDVKPSDIRAGHLCRVGASTIKPSFVLWGDSHSMSMAGAVSEVASGQGLSGLVASSGSCPPLLGVRFDAPNPAARQCAAFNDAAVAMIAASRIKTVFLVASWIASGAIDPGGSGTMVDAFSGHHGDVDNHAVIELGLGRTLTQLEQMGAAVALVHAVPGAKMTVPSAAARSLMWARPIDLEYSARHYRRSNEFMTTIVSRLAARHRFVTFSPSDILCASGTCRAVAAGRALYFDSNHLSLTGARLLSPLFRNAFASKQSGSVHQ